MLTVRVMILYSLAAYMYLNTKKIRLVHTNPKHIEDHFKLPWQYFFQPFLQSSHDPFLCIHVQLQFREH